MAHDPAFAIWLTGLPASGKSTITRALERRLRALNVEVAVLESDALRKRFSVRPSYDERDRESFYGTLAFIAETLTAHGISVIIDATANRRLYRQAARTRIPRFVEVYVECPLEVCMQRDPKGIYRSAKEGQALHVPGLQAVYEPPEVPDLTVRGDIEDPEVAAEKILALLQSRGILPSDSAV